MTPARPGRAVAALVWLAAPVHVVTYLALTVGIGSAPVGLAWLTKLVIDRLTIPGATPLAELIPLAVGLILISATYAVVPHGQRYLETELARRIGLRAREDLYAAVDRLTGLARFENPTFQDRLQLAQHAGQSSPAEVVSSAGNVLQGVITIGGFLGTLMVVSPVIATVVLLAGVPALLAQLALSRRRAAMLWGVGQAERREFFYAGLLTSVQAAKEIRLFGIGGFLRARMLTEVRQIDGAHRGLDRRELVTQTGLAVLGSGVAGAGLLWAVGAASSGRLTVGDITMFVAAVAGTQAALAGLASGATAAHHALLLFGHHLDVVHAEPDLPVPDRPHAVPALRHGIELRDVWFRYSDQHPWVLRGVNLFIPHGRAVALVGLNGSGKSTLVKLLCRFYDPTRGAVLWDGVDLRELDPSELRRRIGAVFQDYMCYDLTAADNIGVGDLAAIDDRERIESAAGLADVHDTLAALRSGYDTLLTRVFFSASDGEDPQVGVMLSGGQWQRVALARALLGGRRDLLILDEPSSGLDAEAEHEIHSRLRAYRAGRTSLLISHRLGTVRDSDHIVVLADGRVVEQGSHDELIADRGSYAHLFTLQASGYGERPMEEAR